jgi:hypothetical protein
MRLRPAAITAFLLWLGCSESSGTSFDGSPIRIERDGGAAGEDAAAHLRLDTASCPSLAFAAGQMGETCAAVAFGCERRDAPEFVESGMPDLCAAALAAGGFAEVSIEDPAVRAATCDAVTIGSASADPAFRISFAGDAFFADQLANSDYLGALAQARIGPHGCTRRLLLAGAEGGRVEIADLPPEGGVVEMPLSDRPTGSITLEPVGDACGPTTGVCLSGDGLWYSAIPGFFAAPCGLAGIPLGGCGDAVGWASVGTSECGGRIHAAFVSLGRVRICH